MMIFKSAEHFAWCWPTM